MTAASDLSGSSCLIFFSVDMISWKYSHHHASWCLGDKMPRRQAQMGNHLQALVRAGQAGAAAGLERGGRGIHY
jgi:hypothetical protein